LVDVCFPDFFYAFEMLQQNRFSFFPDTRDGIQFRLQRGFRPAHAVKSYGKTMRFISDPLQEKHQIRVFAEADGIGSERLKYFVPGFALFFIFFGNRNYFKLTFNG
jgi:hypothetical protein